MSNQRPSVQRKHTRGSEAKRSAELDQGVQIVLDGETYAVRLGDLSALDAGALRRQVGLTFIQLIQAMHAGETDLDIVAAIIWLDKRVKGDLMTPYADVAREIGYEVFDRIEFGEPDAEDVSGPEA